MAGPQPSRSVRVVACVIWMLSRRADLAVAYILARRRRYDLGNYDVSVRSDAVLLMASYLLDEQLVADVTTALASMEDKRRVVADTFLMHSLLAEYIIGQNRKGVVVDLEQAITVYIRLWACRPMTTQIERRLSRLVWNRNERRRFGVNLRREWALTLSTFRTPRDLLPGEIHRRVFI